MPFVAATALGFIIPSPISFGLCRPEELPAEARPFRSPLDLAKADGSYDEKRLFYVKDDELTGFVSNAHILHRETGSDNAPWYEAGISFFDRQDQTDLFKLHLPYVWRTPADILTLFLPPINRDLGGLTPLCGIVETDWYASPINLVLRKPADRYSIHVSAGDPIAQAVFVHRQFCSPTLQVIHQSDANAESFALSLENWRRHKADDRSAYKRLSRSQNRLPDAKLKDSQAP